ncbi:MAG: hypothetical protein WCT04_09540 [Planctomycetota bacterium]
MTESELQHLLIQATRRMSLSAAWNASLRIFAGALILSTLVVCWMRWTGNDYIGLASIAALPFISAALAGMIAFSISRPTQMAAASVLDHRAGTSEHVTTWLHLRKAPSSIVTETQHGFRLAQEQTALRAADAIKLTKHIPMTWPTWSRAIWLCMIALISATLMPPNEPDIIALSVRSPAIGLTAGESTGGAKDASPMLRESPRIQVLSPAQMRKLELAIDPHMPTVLKSELLKELNEAMAGISENELTPEVRHLLNMLRKDLDASIPPKKNADGSISVATKTDAERAGRVDAKVAVYERFGNVEKAWAASETQFEDVRERLARYYGGH